MPPQVCTELREEGFVWTQKKLSEEDPSVILLQQGVALTAQEASKPEALA